VSKGLKFANPLKGLPQLLDGKEVPFRGFRGEFAGKDF
jgi:hypothetical protein